MKTNTPQDTLEKLIDVNSPIIYIHDYDFIRTDVLIDSVKLNGKTKIKNATKDRARIAITNKASLRARLPNSLSGIRYHRLNTICRANLYALPAASTLRVINFC